MSDPQQPAGTGDDRDSDVPNPDATASSFDAAQEMLQAALDEIRGATAEKAAAERTSAAASGDSEWSPRPAPSHGAPHGAAIHRAAIHRAAIHRAGSAEGGAPRATIAAPTAAAASEAAASAAVTNPTPTAGRARGTRRRRRPAAAAAGVAAAAATTEALAPDADEFDGLTDTMYQQPARGTRRRRRPEADAPSEEAVSSESLQADLPPESRADAPESEPFDEPVDEPIMVAATSDDSLLDDETTEASPDPVEADETDVLFPAALAASLPPVAGATTTGPAPTRPRSVGSRRRATQIVAAIVVVVLGIGALVLALGSGGSDQNAVRTAPAAKLTFDPITTPEGATVTHVWELQGRKGSEFTGTLTISNPTSVPLATAFTEVIPKAIAPTVSDLTFNPQPTVIQADPVVRYSLTVAASGTVTTTYAAQVAPDGATHARLDAWAKDLPPTTPTTTTTAPSAVTTTPTTPTTPASTAKPATTPTTAKPTTPTTEAPPPPPTEPPTTAPPSRATVGIQVFVPHNTGPGMVGTFGYDTPNGAISLTTVEGADGNGGASSSSSVDAGSVTLTQSSTDARFHLIAIQCSNGVNVTSHSVTFTVTPGESVTCTFVNPPS